MSDLDRCKKYLRGVLLAHKGGVPMTKIGAKYQDITGESVPYRRFNFNSLEAFLQSIPDVCSIPVQDRDLMVKIKGRGTPEIKHIENLIQRQGRRGGNYESPSVPDNLIQRQVRRGGNNQSPSTVCSLLVKTRNVTSQKSVTSSLPPIHSNPEVQKEYEDIIQRLPAGWEDKARDELSGSDRPHDIRYYWRLSWRRAAMQL